MPKSTPIILCAVLLSTAFLVLGQDMPKRKPITLSASTDGELTNYQVKIDVTYDADMQSDFSDVRFRDNDARSLLDFWLQEYTTSTSATFWVKVSSIAATNGTTIYMYYGDTSAPGGSDIESTMMAGDDFNRASLNNGGSWTKSANNPLFSSADYGDPGLYYVDGTFYAFVEDRANDNIKLLSASTYDAASWTDHGTIIDKGTSGAWDDYKVTDPSIIKIGGKFRVYYAGHDGVSNGQGIGYAESDTITGTYTKYGSNPVISGGYDEPSVVYDGNSMILTASDGNSPSTNGQGGGEVRLWTSADGISWSAQGIVVDDTVTYYDDAFIMSDNDRYLMFVNYGSTGTTFTDEMAVAVSSDGLAWGLPSEGGSLDLGTGGSYDDTAIFAPAIVKVGNTWYMLYQASDGSNHTVCAAYSTDITPDRWYQFHNNFSISSNTLTQTGGDSNWSRSELLDQFEPPYIYEAEITIATAGSGYTAGITFGRDSSGDYIAIIIDSGNNALRLWEHLRPEAGTNAIISTTMSYTINTATSYRFRVIVTSSNVQVDFYNGSWNTNILSMVRTMEKGHAGFLTFNTSATNVMTSDFIFVRKYAADEPTPSIGSEEDVIDLPFLLSA